VFQEAPDRGQALDPGPEGLTQEGSCLTHEGP
jgi:hypothetical protein